jgi:hypothetical protein
VDNSPFSVGVVFGSGRLTALALRSPLTASVPFRIGGDASEKLCFSGRLRTNRVSAKEFLLNRDPNFIHPPFGPVCLSSYTGLWPLGPLFALQVGRCAEAEKAAVKRLR